MDIIFKDKNRIAQVCHGQGKGKEKSEPMTMEYTRVPNVPSALVK